MTVVDGHPLRISGRLVRVARLADEWYDWPADPARYLARLRECRVRADVFSFVQRLTEQTPRFGHHLEWEALAVVGLSDYHHWWTRQINDKTRNMVRKAGKKGVELRQGPCDERFLRGIKEIYDETPIRQGKPFTHYQKDLEVLRASHLTFADQSDFIGAWLDGELIGFVKLVHQDGWSSTMQILSMIRHRDKAPTNALLAKCVEICCERGVRHLQYGSWSRRSFGEFKIHHGFREHRVPRYFVPLTARGRMGIRLGFQHPLLRRLPPGVIDQLVPLRERWSEMTCRRKAPV
jgi:hypothetical protein